MGIYLPPSFTSHLSPVLFHISDVPLWMKHHLFSDISTGLNFVAIGGGNGLSTLLSGLKDFVLAHETEPIWLDNLSATEIKTGAISY